MPAVAQAPEILQAKFREIVSPDLATAQAARQFIAAAVDEVLRKGSLYGPVAEFVFQRYALGPNEDPLFPLDLVGPGVAEQHVAYNVPATGYMPERVFESDFLRILTYKIGNSKDWPEDLVENGSWNIMPRVMELYRAGFVKKNNDDSVHLLLKAAKDRGLLAYDKNAGQGRLTARLLTLMDDAMEQNGMANFTATEPIRMTDVLLSPGAVRGMRDWTLADAPEQVRSQIWNAPDGTLQKLLNYNLHPVTELGYGREYQEWYLSAQNGLGGQLGPNDVEVVLGLNLTNRSNFVNPVRRELVTRMDETRLRSGWLGMYGKLEHGWGVLDNRDVILGSL